MNALSVVNFATSNEPKEKFLQTIQKPGHSRNLEKHTHKSIDKCINEISEWLNHLDEDLKYESVFDDMKNISDIDEFEKKLDEYFPNDSEKFSNEEKENLLKKLNELQERIKKLEDTQENEKHLDVIEKSKKELQTYPKKSWWLKFYNRAFKVNDGISLANKLQDNITIFLENFGS